MFFSWSSVLSDQMLNPVSAKQLPHLSAVQIAVHHPIAPAATVVQLRLAKTFRAPAAQPCRQVSACRRAASAIEAVYCAAMAW